ncbi:hypothetical protein Tco_0137344 [Tanacetum coccineum]
MKDFEAYKLYYVVASGVEPPKAKTKYMKKADESDTSVKKKQPAKKPITKGLTILSKVELSKAGQLKLATKRSKIQFHSSHASGLGDGVDTQLKVPNEQQQNISGINEGASDGLEVPNVPKYKSESEEESWTFSQGDDDDDDNNEHDLEDEKDDEDDYDKNDSDETESDDDGDDFVHLKLSTYKADDQEEEKEEEKTDDDDDEVSSD